MELRKDYILDRYVIISEIRGMRPDFLRKGAADKVIDDRASCIFCPGHEYMTPKEKGRLGDPWRVRWFDNKYPAVEPLGKQYIQTDNSFFTFSDAYGYHEVIVDTNDHEKQLSDFTDSELKDLLYVYKNRILELSGKEHIKYVLIFKNHGINAGTSVIHSHSQAIALNHIPKLVRDEPSAVSHHDTCPYCTVLGVEKESLRRCFENNSFVAFTPYASRFNYEIWLFPKKHVLSITQLTEGELYELASMLHEVLLRLKALGCSYNMFIHNTPEEMLGNAKMLHFHIEIAPRIDIWGGVENGVETYINRISPETAAKFYRDGRL